MIPCRPRWGHTGAHQMKRCVLFTFLVSWHLALRGGDDGGGECRAGSEGQRSWVQGHSMSEKGAQRWGGMKHSGHIRCCAFCFQNNTQRQMSVTKKLKNKETHET